MRISIVDDFYAQPELVRSLALRAEYIDVSQLNYPGFQSRKSYSSPEVLARFSKILNRPLAPEIEQPTFGKFRIMLAETGSRLKVHLDGYSDWTGLIYLTPNENSRGGTGFFRHKESGLVGRVSDHEAQKMGFASWAVLEKTLIEKDTLNADAWEMIDFVGMKFNRLVLFKGNEKFHCHTESFGRNWEDGRMTQNFFFDEKVSV